MFNTPHICMPPCSPVLCHAIITNHTISNVHPSGHNGNQSQQSLQWTHLDKHQSQINQSQARQAIPGCSFPIMGLGSQTPYPRMHRPRQAIPKCIANMHCIKEAAEAQNFRQAELQSSRLHLRRLGKRHKA